MIYAKKKEIKISSDSYVVKKGDTLYSIARKFKTTVENLKDANNLFTNNLRLFLAILSLSVVLNSQDIR